MGSLRPCRALSLLSPRTSVPPSSRPSSGVPGAVVALCAVFLPAFLLIGGALPLWKELRARPRFQAALRGVNAAVAGILLAALYNPVWVSAILTPIDFALALAAFGMLVVWKLPPWLVVITAAVAAFGISLLS